MNRTFVLSVVVVFVVAMILGGTVHHVMLGQEYMKLGQLFRAPGDAQQYFPYMIAAHVVMAIGWTWVYRIGRENKPWLGQGVRFGLAVAVLCAIPNYLIYFAVQPLPSDLVAMQIVLDSIACVILGIVVAAMNRDPLPARA
jgi:drug/metabolite transporter (DMT)-like permease